MKLADFGIARLFGMNQLTTAGGVLGTADYMSPEQADGRPVTARCDQYSLGGVMYALLAGRPPFRAKNLPQMLQLQRFAKPEPVRALRAGYAGAARATHRAAAGEGTGRAVSEYAGACAAFAGDGQGAVAADGGRLCAGGRRPGGRSYDRRLGPFDFDRGDAG